MMEESINVNFVKAPFATLDTDQAARHQSGKLEQKGVPHV
jgi:hypothetical protein